MSESERNYGCFGGGMRGPVLLTGEANIFYFTGFRTTARRPKQIGYTAVLLTEKEKKFFCPKKWAGQIRRMRLPDQGELIPYGDSWEAFVAALKEELGKEEKSFLWTEYRELSLPLYQELLPLTGEIRDITGKTEALRLIKTEEEIRHLREAADIAVAAMEYAKTVLKPGMRERDAAAALEYFMRLRGSDGVPFTMKLLSGENSAVVTNVPGEKELETGDLVLLDFGATRNGYSSDWTRTFCLGKASKEQIALYEAVWKTERACIEKIRPGCTLEELMETARLTVEGSPFAPYYATHLGHSVGIGSHEWPVIDAGAFGILKENMVITIEPGIYVPGLGGVRIEDEILVTKDGHEILTGLAEETFELI